MRRTPKLQERAVTAVDWTLPFAFPMYNDHFIITVLQTTAPISHGSSGGALLNLQGQVLGITSMMMGEGQNINFAIPAKYVSFMLSAETLRPLEQEESAKS
jgi:S1-C subfamily serine protease